MPTSAILPSPRPPATARLGFIAPQVPTLVSEPPAGDGWLHEIKHDGYRTVLVLQDGMARAFTRNGHDWSQSYAPISRAAEALACRSAVIDGEMIVQDENGVSNFGLLKSAIAREPERLVFIAFDLLHLDGRDLRGEPLVERRAKLTELIGKGESCIGFSEEFDGDAATLFAAADRMGLEGIVSKKAVSRYRSGRSTSWLKTKCTAESEFVVIGVERQPGQASFALLAREMEGGLVYAGSAFITLGSAEGERFWSRVGKLAGGKPAVKELANRKAQWLRPEMRVRARHLKGGDKLRHATVSAVIG
jgi:bifunctional non-homologous end joining protein LigD